MNDHERGSLWRDPNGERWQRENWQLWLRHDWERFYTPHGVAEMRLRMGLDPRTGRPLAVSERKYSSDQPRVPAGNPEGGQWTSGAASSSPAPRRDAARRRRVNEAECELQYDSDIFQCKMVGLMSCYKQAAVRYAACLAGDPIPPLNY